MEIDLEQYRKRVELLEQKAKEKEELRELRKRARIAKKTIDKDKPLNLIISALQKKASTMIKDALKE